MLLIKQFSQIKRQPFKAFNQFVHFPKVIFDRCTFSYGDRHKTKF